MAEYPSNSHKAKEAERVNRVPEKRTPVASGKKVKKSEIRKFTDVFIQEDMNSVKDYILLDVVVPAVKTAICDVVKNGIDMLLYGENGTIQKKPGASKVSYRSYYNRGIERRDISGPRARTYEYDDVVVDTRGEAEEAVVVMREIMATYNMVRVADYYELLGVSADYTANNYGWTDISSAHVVRTRDGYMVKMPKPMPLD